jgi:hypothetical protein
MRRSDLLRLQAVVDFLSGVDRRASTVVFMRERSSAASELCPEAAAK